MYENKIEETFYVNHLLVVIKLEMSKKLTIDIILYSKKKVSPQTSRKGFIDVKKVRNELNC